MVSSFAPDNTWQQTLGNDGALKNSVVRSTDRASNTLLSFVHDSEMNRLLSRRLLTRRVSYIAFKTSRVSLMLAAKSSVGRRVVRVKVGVAPGAVVYKLSIARVVSAFASLCATAPMMQSNIPLKSRYWLIISSRSESLAQRS